MGNFAGFFKISNNNEGGITLNLLSEQQRVQNYFKNKGKNYYKKIEESLNKFLSQETETGQNIFSEVEKYIEEKFARSKVNTDYSVSRIIKINDTWNKANKNFELALQQVINGLKQNQIQVSGQALNKILNLAQNLQEQIKTKGFSRIYWNSPKYDQITMGQLKNLLKNYGYIDFAAGAGQAAEYAVALATQQAINHGLKELDKIWIGNKGSSPTIDLKGLDKNLVNSISKTSWTLDSQNSTLVYNYITQDKADIIFNYNGKDIGLSVKNYLPNSEVHFSTVSNLAATLSDSLISNNFNAHYLYNLYKTPTETNDILEMGKKFLILLQISGGLRQKFSAEIVTVVDRNNSSKPIKCYSLEDISNKIFSNSSDIVPKTKINNLINDKNRKEFFKNFLNATIATSILFK